MRPPVQVTQEAAEPETGEATWVAVGALKNQSQSVGVIVLTIGTGTFPTEGEEGASADYTVACKRSVTSPAAWVAVLALEVNVVGLIHELAIWACTFTT
jgi:hypothetical protein